KIAQFDGGEARELFQQRAAERRVQADHLAVEESVSIRHRRPVLLDRRDGAEPGVQHLGALDIVPLARLVTNPGQLYLRQTRGELDLQGGVRLLRATRPRL